MKNVCCFCGKTLQADVNLDNGKTQNCDKCEVQFLLPVVSFQPTKNFEGLASCPFCNAGLSKDKGKTTLTCNKCNIKLSPKDLVNGRGEVVLVSDSDEGPGDFKTVNDKRLSTTNVKEKVIQVNDYGKSDDFEVMSDELRVMRAASDKSRVGLRVFALKSTRAPTNPQTFDENMQV